MESLLEIPTRRVKADGDIISFAELRRRC